MIPAGRCVKKRTNNAVLEEMLLLHGIPNYSDYSET